VRLTANKLRKTLARIKRCRQVESYTNGFYTHLAEKATNIHAKKLFRSLAKAGKSHATLLSGILDNLSKATGISLKKIPTKLIDERYSQDLSIIKDSSKISTVNVRRAILDHVEIERSFAMEYMEIALDIELSDELKTRSLVKEIKLQLLKLAKTEMQHHEQLTALSKIGGQLS